MGATCLSVDCCMYVQPLNRSFSFSLTIDDCNYQISAAIENLVMERKLSLFEFGRLHSEFKNIAPIQYEPKSNFFNSVKL